MIIPFTVNRTLNRLKMPSPPNAMRTELSPRVLLFFSSGSRQIQLCVLYKYILVYNMTKVKLKQLIQVVAGSQKIRWGDMFLGYAAIFAHHAAATMVVTNKGGYQK